MYAGWNSGTIKERWWNMACIILAILCFQTGHTTLGILSIVGAVIRLAVVIKEES